MLRFRHVLAACALACIAAPAFGQVVQSTDDVAGVPGVVAVTGAGGRAIKVPALVLVRTDGTAADTARGAANLATTQVNVGTTATLIAAARTARTRAIITQSAAGPCYFGPTAAVSATTGARLTVAGASKTYHYAGALYGICPGGAVVVDLDEEY